MGKFILSTLATLCLVLNSACGADQGRASELQSNCPAVAVDAVFAAKLAKLDGTIGCAKGTIEELVGGRGRMLETEKGAIFHQRGAARAYALHGAILDLYLELGGAASALGMPTSDVGSSYMFFNLSALFEHGIITQAPGAKPQVRYHEPYVRF